MQDIVFHSPGDVASFLKEQYNSRFLECNAIRARRYLEKHPIELNQEETEFLVQARRLLALGKEVMDSVGVRFWLSSGTCLGKA